MKDALLFHLHKHVSTWFSGSFPSCFLWFLPERNRTKAAQTECQVTIRHTRIQVQIYRKWGWKTGQRQLPWLTKTTYLFEAFQYIFRCVWDAYNQRGARGGWFLKLWSCPKTRRRQLTKIITAKSWNVLSKRWSLSLRSLPFKVPLLYHISSPK